MPTTASAILDAAATDMVFNADYSRAYIARKDGIVSVYDTLNGQIIRNIQVGQQLGGMDISADGTFLLVAERVASSVNGANAVFAVHKVDLASGGVIDFTRTFSGMDGPFHDVAPMADGTAILTSARRGTGTATTSSYTLDTDTGAFAVLASGVAQSSILTVTQDREAVLLSPTMAGNGVLQTYGLVGDGVVELVGTRFVNAVGGAPAVIYPDGSYIFYPGAGSGGQFFDDHLNLVTTVGSDNFSYIRGYAFDQDSPYFYGITANNLLVGGGTTGLGIPPSESQPSVPAGSQANRGAGFGGNFAMGPDDQYFLLIADDHVYRFANRYSATPVRGDGAANTITGGEFGDLIYGLDGNDSLFGGGRTDTLRGGAGNDMLDGGASNDNLYGGDGDDIYIVDDAGDRVVELANAGTDEIRSAVSFALPLNVERLVLTGTAAIDGTGNAMDNVVTGNSGDNILKGGDGNDMLYGLAGNDTLDGGAGNDRIDGGAGFDTLTYASANAGVTVDLSRGDAQATGGSGTDTIVGVEYLIGSAFADVLTGNASNNRIDGGAGDDLIAGGAGSDVLIGGEGVDTVSYAATTTRITIDLRLTTPQSTYGSGADTVSGFENAIGSAYGDKLTGSAGANGLFGGDGNDTLAGGAGIDLLDGGAGDDLLVDGSGDEEGAGVVTLFRGGDGFDTASFAGFARAVQIATAAGETTFAVGNTASVTLSSVEALVGSAFDDALDGDAGGNALYGGAGVDRLRGWGGNDVLDGGAGVDTAYYDFAPGAVTVNLSIGFAQNTGDGADVVRNVENVFGSFYGDRLTGNQFGNALFGWGGDDVLDGGLGANVLDGGEGVDTADYGRAAAGVRANLSSTVAQSTVGAGVDRYVSIENLNGSAFDDTLTGNDADNVLTGNQGNDLLVASYGSDVLNGGGGIDTASFAGQPGVAVNLGVTTAQAVGEGRTVTLSSIENVVGTLYADTITGSAQANVLTGGYGNDVVNGMSGNDVIDGGVGNDVLTGAGGDDRLTGGAGTDVLTGGAGADILTGGTQADRFVYAATGESSAAAADTITDFAMGDILDLAAIDANTTLAGNQAFVRADAFTHVAGQFTLAYDAGANRTAAAFDVNGDATADMLILFTGDVTGLTGGWVL